MTRKLAFLMLMLVLAAALAGCGGGSKNNVNNLWSDVPGLPQAERADIRLPMPLRMIMQTAVRASASGSDVDVDKFDFVGYTTSMTSQEVVDYYTNERMAQAGWTVADQLGCAGGLGGEGMGGGFCMFGKDSGDNESLLLIMPATDESSGETQVYYMRFDGKFSSQ